MKFHFYSNFVLKRLKIGIEYPKLLIKIRALDWFGRARGSLFRICVPAVFLDWLDWATKFTGTIILDYRIPSHSQVCNRLDPLLPIWEKNQEGK